MKNTVNYTQFKFPFDDILKPGVTLDGRFSRHDTWGLDFLPIDELVKDDVSKFFEEKGLPLKNIYFMYGPAQESLVIHVDGFVEENGTFHGIHCGLNWIYGSTNHVMKWYSSDTVGETSVNKEGLRRTRWSASDCVSIEELTIDLPEEFSGTAIDHVTRRKGEMTSMEPKGARMICRFKIPSRGIIGLRSLMLTQTAGEAVMTHRYVGYEPYKGDIPGRLNGSLISMEKGSSVPFSLHKLQERGKFFIDTNVDIYEGQVIGENTRSGDLVVNVTKTKQLTNMRKSGTDDKMKIAPPKTFSLEEALEYIQKDEYVEVTPSTIRIRKIHLKETERKRLPG
jgi:hypothetical protein